MYVEWRVRIHGFFSFTSLLYFYFVFLRSIIHNCPLMRCYLLGFSLLIIIQYTYNYIILSLFQTFSNFNFKILSQTISSVSIDSSLLFSLYLNLYTSNFSLSQQKILLMPIFLSLSQTFQPPYCL